MRLLPIDLTTPSQPISIEEYIEIERSLLPIEECLQMLDSYLPSLPMRRYGCASIVLVIVFPY